MCGNHGQLYGSLTQAFHDESGSLQDCDIDCSGNKCPLKVRTPTRRIAKSSLISFLTSLPRRETSGAALMPRLQICPSHVSILVQNVRGHSSPQGRAHVQSSGNPYKITVGSANNMTLYVHVYMMRLASRFALRVCYHNGHTTNRRIPEGRLTHDNTICLLTQTRSHLVNTHNHRL
jgi:hypothetical protein